MELKDTINKKLASAQSALSQLNKAIKQPKDEFTRDSVIQRFEFCFELAWKLIKDVLLYQGIECSSPRSCIRHAAQVALLSQPETWLKYQTVRNLTTHTYNESTAEKVYKDALAFADDMEKLLDQINIHMQA